ncbi:hypothetical protein ACTMTI_46845 [Nonomuraea sp. H19]|uniref:hypothetical protein n=1 Tax=Nonomuraea sp. H19 TaxID=3452206 RepID=UPI003F8BF315
MDELYRCLPDLPDEVRTEHTDMARQPLVRMVAERERAPRGGAPPLSGPTGVRPEQL